MQACRSFCAVLPGDPVTATRPETCNCQTCFPIIKTSQPSPSEPPMLLGAPAGSTGQLGKERNERHGNLFHCATHCHASTASISIRIAGAGLVNLVLLRSWRGRYKTHQMSRQAYLSVSALSGSLPVHRSFAFHRTDGMFYHRWAIPPAL